MLKNIIKGKIEEHILAITMILIVLLVFAQASSRFFLGVSLSWGSELAIYLHILQVWVGAAFAVRSGGNVRIEVFVNLFPRKVKLYMDLLALIIWFSFALFLAIAGTIFVLDMFETMQRTPTMRILLGIPYLAIPFGGFLMALRLVEQIINLFKDRSSDKPILGREE